MDKNNNWFQIFLNKSLLMKKNNKYQSKISFNYLKVKNQDIVFIIGYMKILSNDFLKLNRLNLVIHESALPKGKGFAPVQWQILEGKNIIPVYLIEASEKVDSGDIVYRDKFKLNGTELYEEIRAKQAKASINIMSKFLKKYPNFRLKKQIGSETFYVKRNDKNSEVDINKSIKKQFNIFRIANNEKWPLFFYYKKKKYILKIYTKETKNIK